MNLQELEQINQRFLNTHYYITPEDVESINKIIKNIEDTRDTEQPKSGDIVIYINKHGKTYNNAIISNNFKDCFEICEIPYTPFYYGVNPPLFDVNLSVSGGAFNQFNKDMFKLKGKTKNKFCVWGHDGACADGAIDFYASVNVWEVSECKL